MLSVTLENKGGRAAKAKLPTVTEARENLVDVERANATLEADLRQVMSDLAGAYGSGNTGQLASLRARRDALYQQQAGLAQDLTMAQETLKAAEGREGAKALEQDKAALIAKYQEAGKRAEAVLQGMEAAYRELLALGGEHQTLVAKLAAHTRRFGSAPADFLSTDVLRVKVGYLAVFERATRALAAVRQHREFLGDAPTEAVADHRQQAEWYKQERERRERIADKNAAKAGLGTLKEMQRLRQAAELTAGVSPDRTRR
jgi:hypothetical protein